MTWGKAGASVRCQDIKRTCGKQQERALTTFKLALEVLSWLGRWTHKIFPPSIFPYRGLGD